MERKPVLFWIFAYFSSIILACFLCSQNQIGHAAKIQSGFTSISGLETKKRSHSKFLFQQVSQNLTSDELIIRTAMHVDLFFHLMTHMNIGEDASSYYSPDYIREIRQEKAKLGLTDNLLEEKLLSCVKLYLSDQKLRIINFLPFIAKSYDELLRGLRWLAEEEMGDSPNPYFAYFKKQYFNSPEAKKFLSVFASYLKCEHDTFYQFYYQKKLEDSFQLKEEFLNYWLDKGQKLLGPLFKIYGRRPLIFLSFSLINHGVGFSSPGFLCAAIKFPESREEIISSFFWSIHEMTHQLVDETTQKSAGLEGVASTNMSNNFGYQLHLLKEKAVVYADYLLIRKFLPELLKEYLVFFLRLYEQKEPADYLFLSMTEIEDKFKITFNLPATVLRALEELYFHWTKSESDYLP